MKRLTSFIGALLLGILPLQAFAAGTITVTSADLRFVTKYTVAWVSDASGNANGTTFVPARGKLLEVHFIPDGSTTQPTDLYDVVVNDVNSVDISIGGGANLSNAATKILQLYPPIVVNGVSTYAVQVSNAGNAKGGTVVFYILKESY